MRLLFLGVHGRGRSPSQRYRFEQFEAGLVERGVEVEYAGALDAYDARDFYGSAPVARKARVAVRAVGRRLWSLRPRIRNRPDVVLVQREAFFLFNHWAEWIAALHAPVVFDFDDAIWIHAVSRANQRFAFLKNTEKIASIVRLSSAVIAGNEFLAAWARQHASRVHVIPTCVDTSVFRPPAGGRPESPVTIGWSGSPSTVAHLRTILPALERVKARLGSRIRFRVMGDASFQHPPLDLRGEPWTPSAELELLKEMHVGLMPLPDDEWSRGKCGLKALTSMASGAATVVSPVGVNTEIVAHGVNGLHADSEDSWVEALVSLVEDPTLRARLAAEGRKTVEERYSVARWVDPLAEVLRTAARR